MLRESFYVFLLLSLCLESVLPITPQRTQPWVRQMTNCSRRPSLLSQGRSRYLCLNRGKEKKTDKRILLQLMGDDYETSWMSDEKPNPDSKVPDFEGMPGRWAQETFLKQFQQLNLTEELKNLQPELLPLEDFIKTWLLKRSSCPVEFTWEDLGPTFWPRWVRKGECLDRKGYCSFPAGMDCIPAATTTVYILRWQCKGRKMTTDAEFLQRQRRRERCDWYRIPYPITIGCFCTC